MKKIVCCVSFSLIIIISTFSQSNKPLEGRYNEITSTAQIGNQQLKYWLYRLPSNITFDDIVIELCEYLENRWEFSYGQPGWPISWDHVREVNPNQELANSIKTMMTRLNRNVSVHFYWNGGGQSPPKGMVINYYDSIKNTYRSIFFYCYQ